MCASDAEVRKRTVRQAEMNGQTGVVLGAEGTTNGKEREIRWRWPRSDGRNEGAVDTHHGGIQPGVEDDGGGGGGGGDGRASAMDGGWSDGSGEWDEGRRMKGRA